MPQDDTVELKWILTVLRRRLWLVLAIILVAVAVALAVTSRMPPSYQAQATLLVALPDDARMNEYSALMAGQQLALTYSQMIKDASTLGPVIAQLGLADTNESLARRISTEYVKDTQLIRITVTDRSAARAAQIANAVATAFSSYIQALETERNNTHLADMAAKVETQRKEAEDTQAKIDELSAQQIKDQAELTRLDTLLVNYRNDYRALQQNQQTLQLTVDQLSTAVRMVEPGRLPDAANGPPYTAEATLLFDQARAMGPSATPGAPSSEQLAETYSRILGGFPVLQAVIREMALTESPQALAKRVKVEPVSGTQLITVSATDEDAAQATRLADTLAKIAIGQAQAALTKPYTDRLASLGDQLDTWSTLIDWTQNQSQTLTSAKLSRDVELARLQTQVAEQRSAYLTLLQSHAQAGLTAATSADRVVVIQRAPVPDKPAGTRSLYVLIATAVAAALALGAAFLLERLNDTIRAPEDVTTVLGLSPLAEINRFPQGREGLIVSPQSTSATAEAFRMLAARLRFVESPGRLRTLLVTSPAAADGKSVVVANLAAALSMTGLRVVAIDADLRAARLHELFGLSQDNGLTDALGAGALNGNLQHTALGGVKFLASGVLPADPGSLVHSPYLAKLLAEATQDADIVLIDSAPLLPVVDSAVIATMVDGVLLVLRTNRSRNDDARQALEALRRVNAHLVGVVLNAVSTQRAPYYGRYYQPDTEKRPLERLLAKLPRRHQTGAAG